MDFCFLCGICLENKRRRYQSIKELKLLAQKHCMKTPFVQEYLSTFIETEAKEPLCVPCVNWKRRCWSHSLKRQERPVLQMDQLIIFLISPGLLAEPDQRCVQRLIMAIKQPTNPLRKILPLQAESILKNMEGDDIYSSVSAWWKYNNNTEFFSSGNTARLVRNVIKIDEETEM